MAAESQRRTNIALTLLGMVFGIACVVGFLLDLIAAALPLAVAIIIAVLVLRHWHF